MKTSAFDDLSENRSEGEVVANPVFINGAVLSPKALNVLTCLQADGNAYIHEIRDHILKSISRSLASMDYMNEHESAQTLKEIRYLNKFIKCIECLASDAIITSCIYLFAA